MDLHHLRSFVVVAEELHFHRAAERLRVTQPSLSQHVRQLEKDLGTPLLTRTIRRVELTTAGREFLARARLILAVVDDAVHATAQTAQGKVGRITVGFTGTSTYELLNSLLNGQVRFSVNFRCHRLLREPSTMVLLSCQLR